MTDSLFKWSDGLPVGGGDMEKSVYDTDDDGKVDAAETADHATEANHAAEADHATTADSALTAGSVPWSGVTGKPYDVVQVARTSSQTISSGTTTAITWNTAEISRYTGTAMWTSGSRVYIRRAGLYRISIVGSFAANTAGGRSLGVRVNGSTFILDASRQADQLWGSFISGSILGNFSAGNYIEATAYQNSGGSLSLTYARLMVEEI